MAHVQTSAAIAFRVQVTFLYSPPGINRFLNFYRNNVNMKYIINVIAKTFMFLSTVIIAIFLMAPTLWWILILAVVFSSLGVSLLKQSKYLGQKKGEEVLKKDKRDPILYLRSFVHDPIATKAVKDFLLARLLWTGPPEDLNTEEEQMKFAVKHFGPFIAIGNPKDTIPKLGVSRIYAESSTWKEIVIDLIKRSQLVILRVGETPGFWWEVKEVLNHKDPEKIMFLLPDELDKYNELKKKFENNFSIILPTNYKPTMITRQTFGAVLIFDSDMKAHIIYCKDRGNWYLHNGLKEDFKIIIRNTLDRSNTQNFSRFLKNRSKFERVDFGNVEHFIFILFGGMIISFLLNIFVEKITNFKVEEDSPAEFVSVLICTILFYILNVKIEKLRTK